MKNVFMKISFLLLVLTCSTIVENNPLRPIVQKPINKPSVYIPALIAGTRYAHQKLLNFEHENLKFEEKQTKSHLSNKAVRITSRGKRYYWYMFYLMICRKIKRQNNRVTMYQKEKDDIKLDLNMNCVVSNRFKFSLKLACQIPYPPL